MEPNTPKIPSMSEMMYVILFGAFVANRLLALMRNILLRFIRTIARSLRSIDSNTLNSKKSYSREQRAP
jgi:hypothetical protein